MRKTRENHGLTKHPLYQKWQDMVRRCQNPNDRRYSWYGAKGITVCAEWRASPKSFIDWCLVNGWKPGMEIDKDITVKGNLVYSPLTCKIVTHQENMKAVVGRESGRKTAKLKISMSEVAAIIHSRATGTTIQDLATKYAVDISTIYRIVSKPI